jgi:hypothetical protein
MESSALADVFHGPTSSDRSDEDDKTSAKAEGYNVKTVALTDGQNAKFDRC